MINLFCAPMKSMSTAQRIEKALSRLRQRYGVTGGLTSEPKIRSIRHGPKVSHNSESLKLFNEDLNTLEVFAYAHNEYDKLSGQLLLDTASRLPNTLKRRHLDYLKKNNVSLNQPSFQSLRDFVLLEIEMTTSDYAIAFFKSEDKDKTKEQIVGRGEVRVRRAAVGSGSGGQESGTAVCGSGAVGGDAKRCFNCLSPEHFVRDCVFRSKCRTCGPLRENKHATALHESYVSDPLTAQLNEAKPKRSDVVTNIKNSCDVLVHKVGVAEEGTVLLRTCAVRVINSNTGCSTLACAQHDTASQATLISDTLRNELGLEAIPDPSITIGTLADQAASCLGCTNFTLQSLGNNDEFEVEGALVVPRFSDDESTLPHAVDTSRLEVILRA